MQHHFVERVCVVCSSTNRKQALLYAFMAWGKFILALAVSFSFHFELRRCRNGPTGGGREFFSPLPSALDFCLYHTFNVKSSKLVTLWGKSYQTSPIFLPLSLLSLLRTRITFSKVVCGVTWQTIHTTVLSSLFPTSLLCGACWEDLGKEQEQVAIIGVQIVIILQEHLSSTMLLKAQLDHLLNLYRRLHGDVYYQLSVSLLLLHQQIIRQMYTGATTMWKI